MNLEREHLEWIQADLDGELDGPARAQLARFLLAHPEARAEREALARVCEALAAIPAEDPPADLCSSILAALPPPPRAVSSTAGRGGLLRSFAGRPAPLRLAAGLAGAALVAGLAYQLASTQAPLSSSELVGTMGSPAREGRRAADLGPVRDEARIEVGGFSAVVALHGAPTAPRISVSVESGARLDVVARAGEQVIRLGGAAPGQSVPGLQVAEFQPLAQPGTNEVLVEIVEPGGVVLQRTTLGFQEGR